MHEGHDGRDGRDSRIGGVTLERGVRLSEFEIERHLESGGFGITYLAHDLSLGRRVAVKEYFPLQWGSRRGDGSVGPRSSGQEEDYAWGLSRFLQEARVLARQELRHPNLVQVYQVLEGNGTAYMVTEFVEGLSLQKALDADGSWAEKRVRRMLAGLLDGLSAVHGAGLLHRDIKPANVMLRASDETPVLIDFGAARYASGEKSGTLRDVLTPGYAPFEQYHSRGRQGTWTDVYALGAVAYRALSGEKPEEAPARVDGDDPLRPMAQAAVRPVSGALASAVDAALSVRVSDRPQTLAAWRALLEGESTDGVGAGEAEAGGGKGKAEADARGDGAPGPSPRSGGGERPVFGGNLDGSTSSQETNRRGWWYAAAVVGVVSAGLLLAFVVNRHDSPQRSSGDLGDLQEPLDDGERGGRFEFADSRTTREGLTDGDREPGDGTGDSRTTGEDEREDEREQDEREQIGPDLNRGQRRAIQRALAAAGCDPGAADGVFGPATRNAIVCWQEGLGEEQTGRLEQRHVALLLPAGETRDMVVTRDLDSGCEWELGRVGRIPLTRRGEWDGSCPSVHYDDGEYARYYAFTLDDPAAVRIDLTSPTVDTWLALRRGAGTGVGVLEEDDDDGDGDDARITRYLEAGQYTVEATTLDGGQTGPFTLSLTADADGGCEQDIGRLGRTPLTRQGAWNGRCPSVHYDDDPYARYYTFTLADPAEVRMDLTTSPTMDAWLALRRGRGTGVGLLEEDDDDDGDGYDARITRYLEAGQYTVEATTLGSGQTGPFTLTLAVDGDGGCERELGRLGPAPRESPAILVRGGAWDGSCSSVHYDDGEYARYYAFTLPESAVVRIDLTSPTVDTWLALRRGAGTGFGLLEEDDDEGDGTNAQILRYLEAGEYTIEATTLDGGETGRFTLTVLAASATPEDLQDLERDREVSVCTDFLFEGPGQRTIRESAWDGTCPSMHYDDGRYARYYSFTLTEPGQVAIDLTSPTEDTWLALRRWTGADMELLDENDDGGADANARISRYLEAGDYTIEATTYRGGRRGDFVLDVSFRR